MDQPITAIVLDMDGLMLDTEPLYQAAWQRAAAELGHQLSNDLYARFLGRPTDDCEGDLVRHFGSAFPLERFRALWPAYWRGLAAGGIAPKPGLHALLAFVAERGLRIAVATSSDREYTAFTLAHAGLAGRFPVIVTRDEVAHGKPAPDLYREAARRLGCAPASCVALDDADAGVLAARAAGMSVVMVPDLASPSVEAAAAALSVLPSLDAARALLAELLQIGPR